MQPPVHLLSISARSPSFTQTCEQETYLILALLPTDYAGSRSLHPGTPHRYYGQGGVRLHAPLQTDLEGERNLRALATRLRPPGARLRPDRPGRGARRSGPPG